MNPPMQYPAPDSEERLEAWLASQPLTPAPDFVARTMQRIRAENTLLASAKAGDEAAVDALLDRWLGEQPLEPDFEPAQLAIETLRTAEQGEPIQPQPEETLWRRVLPFPAWIRSTVALAAAACVALFAYFGNPGTTGLTANSQLVDTSDEVTLPAHYAWAYDSKALLQLSDSLNNGAALLNSDNVQLLFGSDQADDEAIN